MAQVLEGYASSLGDIKYRVEVYDDLYSGDVESITLQDVQLRYTPSTDDLLGELIPSECDILIINEPGFFRNTFIPSLDGYQQTRFKVKIYQDTGSGYSLWWFGLVVQDINVKVEASQRTIYKLKCIDGLATLSEKFYTQNNDIITEPQRTSIVQLLIDVFTLNGLQSLFADTDPYLITSCEWFEDSLTYESDNDPLANYYLDNRVFKSYGDNPNGSEYEYGLTVLEEAARVFVGRIYQSGGAYRIDQYRECTGATKRQISYSKTGVELSAQAAVNLDQNIGTQNINSGRLANNQNELLPAYKRCQITFDQIISSPRQGQYIMDTKTGPTLDVGYLSAANDQSFAVFFNYTVRAQGNLTALRKTVARFTAVITIEDSSSGITWYYSDKNEGQWLPSTSNFKFDTNPAKAKIVLSGNTYEDTATYVISTQKVPVSGNLSIQVSLDWYQINNQNVYVPVTPTADQVSVNATLAIAEGSDGEQQESIYAQENSSTQLGDSLIYDMKSVRIGDGLVQTGMLYVEDSGVPQATSQWRHGNSGAYTNLLNLTTQEGLSLLSTPTEVYDGGILTHAGYHKRLVFNSKGHTPKDVFFSCVEGLYTGRWAVYSYDGANVAPETKYEKRKRLFGRVRANGTQTDLPDGRVGGVEIGDRKGQIDEEAEYQFESSGIQAGVDETVIIAEPGYYKQVMGVFVKVTSVGSVDYNSATASVRYEGYTEDLVDATDLVNAINQGKSTFLPIISGTETRTGVAIKLTIDASAAAGDHEYQVIPLYRSFEDTAEPRLDMVPPLALDADGESTNDFDANWESVEGADGYKLDVATDVAFTSFVSGYNDKDVGNATTDNVSGLTSDTTYYYRVRAYNDVEESDNSNVIEVQTVPNYFISTWNTENTGTSNNDQITLPLNSVGNYNFQVYYNDSLIKTVTTYTDDTITFPDGAGIKEIQIRGTIVGWSFNNSGDRRKITNISNYGVLAFRNNDANHFHGCLNLDISASDSPDLSSTERLDNCFNNCRVLTAIGNWDVSGITLFSNVFRNCFVFNQDIGGWDVSLGTNFSRMFFSARAFNQDISTWNVSSCTRFNEMFRDAEAFNQPIGTWNVSAGTRFDLMFLDATAFNQSLNAWNMSAAININTMFTNCIAYNQPMNLWNVSSVTTADAVFRGASGFDQDIGLWDVSSVTSFTQFLFQVALSTSNCDALLSGWSGLPSLQNSVVFDGGQSTYTQSLVDSGTNTGTGATLIEAGQNFLTTVSVGDVVQNTSAATLARVLSVDSNTQLTLDGAIMNNGDNYEIESSSAAKGRASLILDYSWTITDFGGV